MNTSGTEVGIFWITALIVWGVGLLVLFAVIKAAVKSALRETLSELGILNWMSNVYTAIERFEGPPPPADR